MDTNLPRIQAGDSAMISTIVGQLKSQGIFDEFRRDCIADVDTKPAYQNLRQRVEIYVSKFLSQQTWCTDLNKNQLRDNLRRSINESGVLAWGIDHLVEQIVTPKIYHVFYPQIEAVVKEYLGLENRLCIPNLSVPPPGMNEVQERNIDQKPPEPREETKPGNELHQFIDISKAATVSNAGVSEQYNIGESAQTFMNVFSKTACDVFDKANAKLDERPKSPAENREEITENTNIFKIKSEISDSSDVSVKIGNENKVYCLDEQKKISIDKLEQDNYSSMIEKSKNMKEKDKECKPKRERTTSECNDRDTQKNVSERKDHIKASTHKKTGSDFIKTDKERKSDKHKIVDREKLKSDSGKLKDGKKYENEKAEKKSVQKSDTGKSGSDSLKLKYSKYTDKKSHKNDGSYSKSSAHSTESLKCHKPDSKSKMDSNTKLQKSSDHKSSNKLDKTDKLKIVKSDSKGKTGQENSKSRSDSKQKSSNESLSKTSKHSSENKAKYSDSRTKHHGTPEKSINKQMVEKKSYSSSSSQKSENFEKVRHTISDKKHPERTKSTELSEDSSKSEYPEPKRIKLDHTSTSVHKKSDKHSASHSQGKHSSEKERKVDSSKDDRNKAHSDKQKTSKYSEKPKSSHQERSTDSISNKTDREKSIERKSSSSNDRLKSSSISDKPKSSSSDKQKSSNSDKHRKVEEYRHSKEKEKRKEKIREMKRETCSKRVKSTKEGNSRTSSEGSSSKSKDDIITVKHDIDYSHSVSQKWKIQSQESLDNKDCGKQSPCCNFSPEASSESESHSSKGSDILLNIRPVLGISPSQESCYENIKDNSERNKLSSEVLSHPKELDRIMEDQMRASSDEYEDTSKITQDGKDGRISRLLNKDNEDGAWSDVTISSVHTSDLSSFDDRISLSSSEEIEEENSQKEKKKVPLKEIKKLTESYGSDKDHGDTSSEDEKTKPKTESSRKRTSSEKSSTSSFSRCFDCIGGKREEEPKVEHKWELRRQRKVNPRYASDEFSSIFNSSKWSYSNNLDIGDSDTCEPMDKAPVRKNSHGRRIDFSHHVDSDDGKSRSSTLDKCEIDESDHKRKRYSLRSSESEQGEKGPSVKRQKLKEETKPEIKERLSDFRNDKSVADDSEIRGKYNKRTNLKCLEEKNNFLLHKEDACHPVASTTDIQSERSQSEKDKCKKRINLKFLEENNLRPHKDDSCHPITSTVDIQSEKPLSDRERENKTTEIVSVTNDSEIRDKCNERTNLKSPEENDSPSYQADDCHRTTSTTNTESERNKCGKMGETITIDDSEIGDKSNKSTNIKSLEDNNSLPCKNDICYPFVNTTDVHSERPLSETDPNKCIPSRECSQRRDNQEVKVHSQDGNQEVKVHNASDDTDNKDMHAVPMENIDHLS